MGQPSNLSNIKLLVSVETLLGAVNHHICMLVLFVLRNAIEISAQYARVVNPLPATLDKRVARVMPTLRVTAVMVHH